MDSMDLMVWYEYREIIFYVMVVKSYVMIMCPDSQTAGTVPYQ